MLVFSDNLHEKVGTRAIYTVCVYVALAFSYTSEGNSGV